MLGDVREWIVEEPVAVMRDDSLSEGLIDRRDAERRAKILARQRIAFAGIVRRPDDHEEAGVSQCREVAIPPSIRRMPSAIVDVRRQQRSQRAGRLLFLFDRRDEFEKTRQLSAESVGVAGVAANARWLAHRPSEDIAEIRSVEKRRFL